MMRYQEKTIMSNEEIYLNIRYLMDQGFNEILAAKLVYLRDLYLQGKI